MDVWNEGGFMISLDTAFFLMVLSWCFVLFLTFYIHEESPSPESHSNKAPGASENPNSGMERSCSALDRGAKIASFVMTLVLLFIVDTVVMFFILMALVGPINWK
jgi:hypothetical protein